MKKRILIISIIGLFMSCQQNKKSFYYDSGELKYDLVLTNKEQDIYYCHSYYNVYTDILFFSTLSLGTYLYCPIYHIKSLSTFSPKLTKKKQEINFNIFIFPNRFGFRIVVPSGAKQNALKKSNVNVMVVAVVD